MMQRQRGSQEGNGDPINFYDSIRNYIIKNARHQRALFFEKTIYNFTSKPTPINDLN